MVSKSNKEEHRRAIAYSEKSVVRDAFRQGYAYGMDYNPTKVRPETWDRMMEDAQVRAALAVITLSALAKGYEFQYPGQDKELGDQMIKYLFTAFERVNRSSNNIGGIHPIFQEMINNALGTGYTVSEIVYEQPDEQDGYIYMKKWKVLPKTTLKNCFRISDYGDLEKVIQNRDSHDGEVTFSGKDLDRLVIWSHLKDAGNWYGTPELKFVYKNWWSKQYYLQFWGIALERYATPWLVAYVEYDYDVDSFNEALDKSRPNTNFVTCQGNEIKVMESSGNGIMTYERAIKYHDEQIMRGLLVPTLVMGIEETGARALGDTHFDLFSWRIQDVQEELADAVQLQINRLIDINFDNVDAYPKLVFQPLITKDRKMLTDMLEKLLMQGVISPKEKWIRPFLGLPPPDMEAIEAEEEVVEEEPEEEESEGMAKHNVQKFQDDLVIEEDFRLVGEMFDTAQAEVEGILDEHTKEILKQYKTAIETERFVADDNYNLIDDIDIDTGPTEEAIGSTVYVSYMGTNDYLQDLFLEVGLGASGEVDEGLLEEYTRALAKSSYHSYYDPMVAKMNNRVVTGLARGDTNKEIYDALLEISGTYTRAQAETHARTVISYVVNQSRLDYYRKNKDFVVGARYSAILDDRTTVFCEDHHGMFISIDDPLIDFINPPNHHQCTHRPDTKILTDNGWVKIKDISVGDMVMTHRGRYNPVTCLHHIDNPRMYDGEMVKLWTNGRTIEFTPEHPVLTLDGWKSIGDINVGDAVLTIDKKKNNIFIKYVVVEKKKQWKLRKKKLLYNISVKDDESYIAKTVVVHNCRSVLVPVTTLDEDFKPDWSWGDSYPQKGFGQEEILDYLQNE